jgi:Icc-related predicted phosphoesterase
MRMLFVADLHYALKQFDWLVARASDFDLVVIGGDLLDLSSPLDFGVQILVVEKYLERISDKTRLLVSSGNHDGDSRNAADESVAQWLQECKPKGLLVDGDSVHVAGATMTVCPWWDGPVSRAQLEDQLAEAAQTVRGPWIWIHHAPPAGSAVCWAGKKSVGDEYLLGWIQRFAPDVVFSGHIHNSPFQPQGSWVDRINRTWVFNPGRQLGPCPAYITLDLNGMTAEWRSLEGESVRQLALVDR